MITFGRKLKHLRQKNHLTQKELGIALGFPEDSADVRIAQYEADARKPRDEILAKMAKILYVPIDVLTVPVLSEPREYDARPSGCMNFLQNYNFFNKIKKAGNL